MENGYQRVIQLFLGNNTKKTIMGYNMKRGNSAVPFKKLGSSPAKQKNIGEELQKKYKGKSSTTDREGKLKYGAPEGLTQEQRSDLQQIIERNKKNVR